MKRRRSSFIGVDLDDTIDDNDAERAVGGGTSAVIWSAANEEGRDHQMMLDVVEVLHASDREATDEVRLVFIVLGSLN